MNTYQLTITRESAKGTETWETTATDKNIDAVKAGLRSGEKPGDTLTIRTRKV